LLKSFPSHYLRYDSQLLLPWLHYQPYQQSLRHLVQLSSKLSLHCMLNRIEHALYLHTGWNTVDLKQAHVNSLKHHSKEAYTM
jgi:EAL domain-containing protein (putative c-di-GMP-specific phosphodiesterase class I)